MPDPRDNPVLAALSSAHAHLSIGDACSARYEPEVAPFAALAHRERDLEAVVARLVPGESVVFVGVVPPPDARLEVEQRASVLQMDLVRAPRPDPGVRVAELGSDRIADMLALTGLVYPFYFRRGTPRMGRYFGVHDGNGALVAMAGERMRTDTHCEISAVCTHPDHAGRGHARRLVEHVAAGIHARGQRPFLHVSPENERAVRLYRAMDFETRAELPLLRVRRLPD